MKNSIILYLTIALIIFSAKLTFAQSEQCGTMQNLEFQLQKDPKLRAKLDSIEKVNELILRSISLLFSYPNRPTFKRTIYNKKISIISE